MTSGACQSLIERVGALAFTMKPTVGEIGKRHHMPQAGTQPDH
jgi:hypothetical protein